MPPRSKQGRTQRRGWRHSVIGLLQLSLLLCAESALARESSVQRGLDDSAAVTLSDEERAWLERHPVIRMAPDPDYAPFQFRDEGGGSQGIADDFQRFVGAKLGLRIELVQAATWAEALEMVERRQADLVAVAKETAERKRYMDFTAAWVEFPDVIITRSGYPKVTSLDELHARRVASVQGFAINGFLREQHPAIELLMAPDVRGALESVSMGEADATVMNIATTSYTIEKWKITNLRISGTTDFSYRLAFAVRKDWPMLRRLLDKGLAAITTEEKREILRKWIAMAPDAVDRMLLATAINLTQPEKQWLEAHREIRIGVDPAYPPFDFVSPDGVHQGVASDYVRLLGERLGISLNVVTGLSWPEVLAGVQSGRVDLIPLVSKTEERARYLHFSEGYLSFPNVLVTRDDEELIAGLSELGDRTMAIVEGYANTEALEKQYPTMQHLVVRSPLEGLNAVAVREADGFVGNLGVVGYLIKVHGLTSLKVAAPTDLENPPFSIGVRKDWPELVPILNKALASITVEERLRISRKWISVADERPIDYTLVWQMVLVMGAILALVSLWALQVQRQKRALRESEEETRRARDAAEEASRAKSAFLAVMSHEIRSPLSAIVGLTDLAGRADGSAKRREYLRMARGSADALLALVNDILDLSKIESGKFEMDRVAFDLRALVRETVEPIELQADRKAVAFTLAIDDRVPTVILGAAGAIRQVLINLLGNAVKFTHQGAVGLEIDLAPNDARTDAGSHADAGPPEAITLRFVVRDTGIGIPAHLHGKIFDSFTQVDGSTTRKYGGTGLGTTIVKQLVERMGGAIRLDSAPGRGTVVTFALPARRAAEGAIAKPASPGLRSEAHRRYEPRKILLAEDNILNRYVAEETLRLYGQQVTTVDNGRAAAAAVEEGQFDLVLMDLMMPEMDGCEATRRIREREQQTGVHLPIVALTAGALTEERERCLAAGMDDYFAKPVDYDLLMQRIAALTGASPLTPESRSVSTGEPAAAARGAQAPYDLSLLRSRIGASEEKLRELLIWFVTDTAQRIEDAERGLAVGSTRQLAQACHKIRGSAESLAADELKRCAEAAEEAGKAGAVAESRDRIRVLRECFEPLARALVREFQLPIEP